MTAVSANDVLQCIFLDENDRILVQMSLKFVPNSVLKGSIGSANGFATNRWQVITWTDDDSVDWRIYAALGGDELIHEMPNMRGHQQSFSTADEFNRNSRNFMKLKYWDRAVDSGCGIKCEKLFDQCVYACRHKHLFAKKVASRHLHFKPRPGANVHVFGIWHFQGEMERRLDQI